MSDRAPTGSMDRWEQRRTPFGSELTGNAQPTQQRRSRSAHRRNGAQCGMQCRHQWRTVNEHTEGNHAVSGASQSQGGRGTRLTATLTLSRVCCISLFAVCLRTSCQFPCRVLALCPLLDCTNLSWAITKRW